MTDSMFEETTDIPVGRKARVISDDLWKALQASSERGVAFSRTADPQSIDDLRKDLASAAVKAKYDVTTQTAELENGKHRLTFAAKSKVAVKADTKASK